MKTLYMVFKLETGKNLTVSLKQPKDDLASEDVEPVMNACVTKQAFKVGTATITSIVDAYIREVNDTDIL